MSKAILEFALPEEKEEFEMATKAGRYYSALWHVGYDILGKNLKYDENLTDSQRELLEKINQEFWETIGDLLE